MKSKPISYFRELSVVVIGVLITLSITQGITYCSKQNEVRHTLTLIKTELADNIENINCAQKKWETELRIYALLRENIDNLKAIPLDTLSRYSNVIGDIHSINCVSDTYEVFKSSLLMNSVKNKDFLSRLSNAYSTIQTLSMQLSRYSDMKSNALNDMLENVDVKDLGFLTRGDVFDIFQTSLRGKKFLTFIYAGNTIIDPRLFGECRQIISQTIEELSQQIK